ncbi:chromosome transmission fidelity protein 18 homolog [Saccostrea cucullata]|uniref:chromosome transmission fidelity protein 18 homolog n=1 Tax=Saccostrea cuccullata TaxID=36930 RepID=UPI002ED132C5
MDEDDFESQYADELDALEDFEPPDFSPCKTKRSLKFETPNAKVAKDLNTSHLELLESPEKPINGAILSNGISCRPEKRLRSEDEFDNLSGSDNQEEEFPTLKRQTKKARTDDLDIPPSIVSEAEKRITEIRRHHVYQNGERHVPDLIDDYDYETPRVHKRIPNGDFISTTSSEGERCYIILKEETTMSKEFEDVGKKKKKGQLLSVSFEELRDQAEKLRQEKLIQEAEKLTQELHRDLTERLSDDDEDEEAENSEPEKLLWVEKFAPSTYTDLLSDESINRTLLHWLKLWDYVVFGKDVRLKKKEVTKKEKEKDQKKKKFLPEVIDELDKHNRPVQKLVLLNGPPGLGKTTLAHVIAKHSGYNVVEMNASDDRSADVFKTKLEAATQMKSVLESDPRPNCLIIDEIDGAPSAAINLLLNFVKRSDDPGSKKKKKDEGILLRPIICICNDQYVPALRQLRMNALVINFPQTEPARLASRLSEVAKAQSLKTDLNTLLALCDKTENDIRSCINTLQFCFKQKKELSMRTVQTMNVGQKDSNKSLFSMWYEVFSMPRPKRNKFISLHDIQGKDWKKNDNLSLESRFKNILHSAQCTGEYSKVIQGMFENYLECKFKDPKMEGLVVANDWLCFTDLVNCQISQTQNYSIMPYIPYVTVTFHLLFASNQPQRIQYPHADQDALTQKQKSSNLVTSLMSDMVPSVRMFVSEADVVQEVLPPLLEIIQPSLRPVNTQLYSVKEKQDLAELIRIMIAYNMTYNQEKTPEGQYAYVLDPNMEEVARFQGMKQHKQLTYAAKQLISREIGLERLRRNETPSISSKKTKAEAEKDFVPNHLQRLEAKPVINQEEAAERDFFGRVIKRKTHEAKAEDKKEKKNVLNTDIWFHFTEGFSNAVRRNVRVQDFI